MKTKHLFSVVLLAVSLFLFENLQAQVTKIEIEKASKNFLLKNVSKANSFLVNKIEPLNNETQTIAFVVQLKPQGFIIFSNSQNISPVVAFSFDENFDF